MGRVDGVRPRYLWKEWLLVMSWSFQAYPSSSSWQGKPDIRRTELTNFESPVLSPWKHDRYRSTIRLLNSGISGEVGECYGTSPNMLFIVDPPTSADTFAGPLV